MTLDYLILKNNDTFVTFHKKQGVKVEFDFKVR